MPAFVGGSACGCFPNFQCILKVPIQNKCVCALASHASNVTSYGSDDNFVIRRKGSQNFLRFVDIAFAIQNCQEQCPHPDDIVWIDAYGMAGDAFGVFPHPQQSIGLPEIPGHIGAARIYFESLAKLLQTTSPLPLPAMNVFSAPGSPFTRTRPALISSSAPRLDATPARAR